MPPASPNDIADQQYDLQIESILAQAPTEFGGNTCRMGQIGRASGRERV
jgi:hypothetical protein